MAEHVCPVWMGYLLASPLRRLVQNPEKILAPYLRPGMTALDIGCAMGFFSVPMARLVGSEGQVICVDMQEKMFPALRKRARKAHCLDRMAICLCAPDSLSLDERPETADFALAMAVAHEVPHLERFFAQVFAALKPGAAFLMAEPRGHISPHRFEEEVVHARRAGFISEQYPRTPRCRAVLLRKPGSPPDAY